MGADFPEQEESVKRIRALSEEDRNWIGHHMRNSLCAISALNEIGDKKKVREVIEHMEADLEMFGL